MILTCINFYSRGAGKRSIIIRRTKLSDKIELDLSLEKYLILFVNSKKRAECLTDRWCGLISFELILRMFLYEVSREGKTNIAFISYKAIKRVIKK